MIENVFTHCLDVVAYRQRLKAHTDNDIGLASKICTNAKYHPVINPNPVQVATEFWIEPFKTNVKYNGNKSYCCSKVTSAQAYGIKDEDGNTLTPSLVDALNINPLNGQYEPVMEVWGIGEVGGDNCIYDAFSDEQKAEIREFWPETVAYEDEDGDEQTYQQSLIWEALA